MGHAPLYTPPCCLASAVPHAGETPIPFHQNGTSAAVVLVSWRSAAGPGRGEWVWLGGGEWVGFGRGGRVGVGIGHVGPLTVVAVVADVVVADVAVADVVAVVDDVVVAGLLWPMHVIHL